MSVSVLKSRRESSQARDEMRRRGIDCLSPPGTRLLRKIGLLGGVDVGHPEKSWDVLRTLEFLERALSRPNIDSNPEDIGKRLDVWVWAPGYHEAIPDGVEWLAISGPDMCYRKRDWSALRPRIDMNLPVLTVPLLVWRSLVARLQAPPSAGVLMLAWLNQLIGSWDGITSVGIGIGIQGCYHHSDPKQQAAARHDWPGEQTLVHEWRKQGLRVLPQ